MDAVTVYWIMFLTGLGFAVLSGIFVGLGQAAGGHETDFALDHDADLGGGVDTVDFGHGDMHADMDMSSGDFFHAHGEIALSPVSPITIFSFMGGFGGGGLLGTEFGWPVWGTVLLALVLGFILAFSIYYFMYLLNKSNVSSEARATEALGTTAEMITPIVEDQMGEIAYITRGSRYVSPARSIDGRSITKGRAVKIWRIVGSTAYVKEILPEEAEHPPVDTADHPEA